MLSSVMIVLNGTNNAVSAEPITEIQYNYRTTAEGVNEAIVNTYNRNYEGETVTIPSEVEFDGKTYTVVEIAEYAFGSYSGPANETIKSVTIPSTVKIIGKYAFARCSNLTTVTLSEGLEKICKFAFWKTPIGSLVVPESVTTIEQSICEECHYLKIVEIKADAEIGNFVFKNCIALESAIVHAKSLGQSAFGGCKSLQYVTLMDGTETLGHFAFNGDEKLYRIEFPDSLTTVPSDIFNTSSDPSFPQMYEFRDLDGNELELNAENLKGKIWQKKTDGGYFAQVTRLTLDANGGTLDCEAEQYIFVNDDLHINDPTREGYDNFRWDPALPQKMPSTNLSCKAIWLVESPEPKVLTYENEYLTPYHGELAFTVSGELTEMDVSEYTVVFKLTNPENSCWDDDETSGDREIKWKIVPKKITVKADKHIEKDVGEDDPDFKKAVAPVEGIIDGFVIQYSATCDHPEKKGTYRVEVSGEKYQGNYEVSYEPGDVFTINAKEIPKPIAKTGLVYDGNLHYGIESGPGYDLEGEISGTNSTAVVMHDYVVTVTIKTGYQWEEDPEKRDPFTCTWTIAQKPLTVKPIIPMSRTTTESDPTNYDASVPAPDTIGSDTIEFTTSREPGTLIGKYDIYVTGEESQGNYRITYVTGEDMFSIVGTVIPVPVAIGGLIYNGKEQTGVPEGAGYTLSEVWKATNADTYTAKVTPVSGFTWEGGGTDEKEIHWTIAQKQVDVIVKHRVVKLVGEADPQNYGVTAVVIEGNLNGDPIAYQYERDQGEVIGHYNINVSGDQNQGNYTVSFHGAEKFYIEGEKVDRPVARTGLVYNGGLQIGVAELKEYTITGNKESNATRGDAHHTATATIKVGYEWTTNPEDRSPYDIEWKIAPLEIEVKADKQLNKLVGAADPDFNEAVTVHGLVDNFAVIYQASCTHNEAIGDYHIVVTGASEQGNYDVTYSWAHHMFEIRGTVIDKPAPVNVVYNSNTQTGVLPGTGYTITGNTGINATRGTPLVAHADIQVGYEWAGLPGIRSTLDIPWEIEPAKLAAIADSQAVEEGEPAQPFTVSFRGFQGNDDISVITVNQPHFDCDYVQGSPTGYYDIVLSGDFEADNYDFILENGYVLCGKEVLDKPVAVIGLTYSGEELIGVVASAGFTVTGERATAAGSYVAIVTPDEHHIWSDATSGPFELPWEILKTKLIIAADDEEVSVGDPAPSYTATVKGFVHGEGMSDLQGSLKLDCRYTSSSPAGDYPIVPSGVSSDNYDIVFKNGVLTATNHDPKPKPVPPVIPVSVEIVPTAGGQVSIDSLTVPLNSKVTLNGSMLIIGFGPSAKIVKAIADPGYVFDSWSIEDGTHLLEDTKITASFKKISIIEIAVWESPDKTSYGEGDKFDPEGLVILITYSDGSQVIVEYEGNESDFSFNPSLDTPLKAGETEVTVIYGGHSTDVPITVSGEKDPFPWWIIILILILVIIIVVWRRSRSDSKN